MILYSLLICQAWCQAGCTVLEMTSGVASVLLPGIKEPQAAEEMDGKLLTAADSFAEKLSREPAIVRYPVLRTASGS
jgi:hypothetical protein